MLDELIGKQPDEMTLVIGDTEITMESAKFLRTMDTIADCLTCTIPWEPGLDEKIDRLTAPYSYSEAGVYLGGKLQSEAILYNVKHKRDNSGSVKELEIYTKTADIIDSTVIPPYEASNISLTDRCKQQCGPFGINVLIGDGINITQRQTIRSVQFGGTGPGREIPAGIMAINGILDLRPTVQRVRITYRTVYVEPKFSRVSAEQTDTIFEHLKKLARERGFLLSCTKNGDLLVTRANTQDPPVGTIEDINPVALSQEYDFKGRDRFAMYRAIASSSRSGKPAGASVSRDPAVKAPRILTFSAGDDLPGEGGTAASWRKNKAAADAMTIPFPVTSWYAPNGKLWEPNTTVTVFSDLIGSNGFTFLITQVEYNYGASGTPATLQLKPPTMYTTGEIVEPWLASV
jgi:prophage tail gpP-like protein